VIDTSRVGGYGCNGHRDNDLKEEEFNATRGGGYREGRQRSPL